MKPEKVEEYTCEKCGSIGVRKTSDDYVWSKCPECAVVFTYNPNQLVLLT